MLVRRRRFFYRQALLDAIQARAHASGPDFITFVGDGEPTLYTDLGWLIDQVKERLACPVAVITNGSLLYRAAVRRALKRADVVMPSLDAGEPVTFKRINRPHRCLVFDTVWKGIREFRKRFAGQLWVEVMLVRDLNDSPAVLKQLREILARVRPHRVYVTTPVRPPAEAWAVPPEPTTVIEAQGLLGAAAALTSSESGTFGLEGFRNAAEAIEETGSRHPLRLDQARAIETQFGESRTVKSMLAIGRLIRVSYHGDTYVLPAHFVRGTSSRPGREVASGKGTQSSGSTR
jgi:wyosine [tRNA(Phe)-imidazoG37] synthetase (radical SAM superfamily)